MWEGIISSFLGFSFITETSLYTFENTLIPQLVMKKWSETMLATFFITLCCLVSLVTKLQGRGEYLFKIEGGP